MQHLKIRINGGDIFFLVAMTFVVAFPNPSMFKALSIIAFFAYTLVISIFNRRNTRNLLQYVWAIAFFAFGHLSKIWSVYPTAASEVLNNVQWGFLLSVAIANYVVIYKMNAVDIAKRMVVIALVFFIDVILNGGYVDGRFTVIIDGYYLNENVFGQIALGIACYLLYWSKKKKWKSLPINCMLIALVVLCLISGSRKSLITLAIYVVFILMYEKPPRSWQKTITRIFALALTIGMVYFCVMNVEFLYTSVGIRIESFLSFMQGDVAADGSAQTRFLMIEKAFELFLEKPILGHGLNTFAYQTAFGAYSHNNYLELLANVGMVGFLIYYIPVFVYFSRTWSSWKKCQEGSVLPLALIVAFVINDFAIVSYFSIVSQAFFGLAIGLCINVCTNSKRTRNDVSDAETSKCGWQESIAHSTDMKE